MADKEEKYSVDEMLKGYAKKKRAHSEETYGTHDERARRHSNSADQDDEERRPARQPLREDEGEYRERRPRRQDEDYPERSKRRGSARSDDDDYYGRRPARRAVRDDDEYYERPPRRPDDFDEEDAVPKPMVRNKPLIILTYALRSLAVSLMLMLMLFIILHDVMKKQPVISYFSVVGDNFMAFLSTYLEVFILAFAATFTLQLSYYLLYRAARGRWRVHTREEVIYSILFAIIGMVGSGAIIWMLGI